MNPFLDAYFSSSLFADFFNLGFPLGFNRVLPQINIFSQRISTMKFFHHLEPFFLLPSELALLPPVR